MFLFADFDQAEKRGATGMKYELELGDELLEFLQQSDDVDDDVGVSIKRKGKMFFDKHHN